MASFWAVEREACIMVISSDFSGTQQHCQQKDTKLRNAGAERRVGGGHSLGGTGEGWGGGEGGGV